MVGQEASEILKKLQNSHNLVVHNSTDAERRAYYYFGDTLSEMFDMHLSGDERKKIQEAEKSLQTRVKQAAKKHKENLTELLGKLKDKYEVELATIDRSSSRLPISVKLTDKSVEVPLSDWGAGTQNRTRIMISVLEAVRLSNSDSPENRSAPLVLVEEPESFLHPSAQAEFGRVLSDLAREFNIQILATTHSPYMLNQSDPPANILIERKLTRGKARAAEVVDVSASNWMQPFSRILGVASAEFPAWHEVFSSAKSRVVLVEGAIDKEYFEFIKKKYPEIYHIPPDVEVVSYGGKDSLKNTQLLKFMTEKFAKIFITFDLDCRDEAEKSLQRLGLVQNTHYCWIGVDADGAQCIEGLLPDRIRGDVYGSNIPLVTKLQSASSKVRNEASAELKKKYLEAFKSSELTEKELSSFKNVFKVIGRAFA
ncbi:ATP-dependent endonuclease [Paracoccus sp. SY]|uniref:ATP-dependent nuclease n=1 Tax=Paracoccus sp. SY TaxID=1330255 RepID=UPI000CD21036|nr:AAA family ATPase [Paracoccus sp. SY]